MIKRVQLVNSTQQWRANGRYKVNTVVTYLEVDYQNKTGANSLPSLLNDWIVVSGSVSTITKKEAVYYIGGQDNTGFTGVVEKFNNTGINFTFTRIVEGYFTCPEFDVSNYIFESIVYTAGKFCCYVVEKSSITTYISGVTVTPNDAVFEFGGIIKITKI